jgi:hypothetical protein
MDGDYGVYSRMSSLLLEKLPVRRAYGYVLGSMVMVCGIRGIREHINLQKLSYSFWRETGIRLTNGYRKTTACHESRTGGIGEVRSLKTFQFSYSLLLILTKALVDSKNLSQGLFSSKICVPPPGYVIIMIDC